MASKITTVQIAHAEGDSEEPITLIARSIIDLSDAWKRIDRGIASRGLIITLVHAETRIARRHINKILDVLPRLARIYTKEAGK